MGRSGDFMSWEDPKGDEVEFSSPKHVQDQLGAHSPRTPPVDFRQKKSSLSPRNYVPTTSRSREIRDGRGELMKMIRNMPESEYELSLKDIVDEEKIVEGEVLEEEVVAEEEKKGKGKIENRIIPQKSFQIQRSERMEREAFLLKAFLPISPKLKARKLPEIRSDQIQTSEGSAKQTNKDWWKMISIAVKENQLSTIINSNRAREKKSKLNGRRGCLF